MASQCSGKSPESERTVAAAGHAVRRAAADPGSASGPKQARGTQPPGPPAERNMAEPDSWPSSSAMALGGAQVEARRCSGDASLQAVEDTHTHTLGHVRRRSSEGKGGEGGSEAAATHPPEI